MSLPGAGSIARPLRPGDILAVLGGGQLGRYLVMSAQRAGLKTWVVDPSPSAPAGRIADRHWVLSVDALSSHSEFEQAAVVTCEFENFPRSALLDLAKRVPFRPGVRALAVAQDRIVEKKFLSALGLPIAPWVALTGCRGDGAAEPAVTSVRANGEPLIHRPDLRSDRGREFGAEDGTSFERGKTEDDVAQALSAIASSTGEVVLKTARLGYDGHGQRRLDADGSAGAVQAAMMAWRELGGVDCVIETRLDLLAEASVVVARAQDAATRAFPPIENEHRAGILHRSRFPAATSTIREAADELRDAAVRVAEALDLVGVLTVEFFFYRDAYGNSRWAVNEIAPRPHNSGHVTLDAGGPSQFDLQLAAVAGWALPDVSDLQPVTLYNLLGAVSDTAFDAITQCGDARLHWYGKDEARPGRKMGHVCRVGSSEPPGDALSALLDAAPWAKR
ncbi:MAG: 5-(carboxyamino)imidazole ribonucleotide synthase [Thioalkalivibrionaceae bacterium]